MNEDHIGITRRHFWLRDRVKSCIEALNQLELDDEWASYRDNAKELAEELLWATTEWEKFYP